VERLSARLAGASNGQATVRAGGLGVGSLVLIVLAAAGFMVYGLYDFITQLHMGPVRVVTGVLAFISNVLLDTLIGTDAIIAAMSHFKRRGQPDPREEQLRRESEAKLDVFCA